MNGGRIGKVRMKDTGFEFRVIEGPRDPEADMAATMLRHARQISSHDGMVGSLVVGIFEDCKTSVGFRWDDDRTPMPRSLLPSWVAEIIRREVVTAPEAEDLFGRMFEWVE